MFVRCKKRFKDGKEHRYWSVVENVRVSGGRVVQRQVLYLGEINDSQRAAWWRSIEVVEGASRSKQVARPRTGRRRSWSARWCGAARGADLARPAPVGGMLVGADAVGASGAGPVLGTRLPASREGTMVGYSEDSGLLPPYRPRQRLASSSAVEHSALRDLLGCDRVIASTTLYRCLDKLTAHKQEFFSFLRARWTTLFNARFDILLYDLTSTYFESDAVRGQAPVRPRRGAAIACRW